MLMKTNRLIKDLKNFLSSANVLETLEERYAYAQDASNSRNIENIPDVVVFVESTEQVQQVVRLANKYKVPIICRGAGTNVVGSCVVVHGGIILNFSRMNKILEIKSLLNFSKKQAKLYRCLHKFTFYELLGFHWH